MNTTLANILALAPALRTAFPPQVAKVVVTAADLLTSIEINGTANVGNPGAVVMPPDQIALELATAINTNLGTLLTALASGPEVIVTAKTPGVPFTLGTAVNCTATITTPNADILALVLNDVILQVSSCVFGNRQEEAQRYLAAHLLTMMVSAMSGGSAPGGPMTSQQVGQVSVQYASLSLTILSRYDTTPYGMRFSQIKNMTVVPIAVY